jgi:serine/threonine protein kinase
MYDPSGACTVFCGSPFYAAPEVLQGVPYVGPEIDVWSLGIILYSMVTSALPFSGTNLADLSDVVVAGRFMIPEYISPRTSSWCVFPPKMQQTDPRGACPCVGGTPPRHRSVAKPAAGHAHHKPEPTCVPVGLFEPPMAECGWQCRRRPPARRSPAAYPHRQPQWRTDRTNITDRPLPHPLPQRYGRCGCGRGHLKVA